MRWPPGLDTRRFLEGYWQKQPLCLRGALTGYGGVVEGDDLAGLACEPEIESRIALRHPGDRWELRHGPFEERDFAALPPRDWTLLVQDLDKHLAPVAAILEHFSFVPAWRLDDVMISYAAPGGSVGAHVDAYDVFLLQAAGTRRWALDPQPADLSLREDVPLGLLRRFTTREEHELRPGDVLYLPPGVAHHGIGDDAAVTWSIGFRAPSAGDLLREFADTLDERDPAIRYADPDLAPGEAAHGLLGASAIARARGLLEQALLDAAGTAADCLGRAVTRQKPWLMPDPTAGPASATDVRDLLANGARLRRHPHARIVRDDDGDHPRLFADGSSWRLSAELRPLAGHCAGCDSFGAAELGYLATLPAATALLAKLIQQGSLSLSPVTPRNAGTEHDQ